MKCIKLWKKLASVLLTMYNQEQTVLQQQSEHGVNNRKRKMGLGSEGDFLSLVIKEIERFVYKDSDNIDTSSTTASGTSTTVPIPPQSHTSAGVPHYHPPPFLNQQQQSSQYSNKTTNRTPISPLFTNSQPHFHQVAAISTPTPLPTTTTTTTNNSATIPSGSAPTAFGSAIHLPPPSLLNMNEFVAKANQFNLRPPVPSTLTSNMLPDVLTKKILSDRVPSRTTNTTINTGVMNIINNNTNGGSNSSFTSNTRILPHPQSAINLPVTDILESNLKPTQPPVKLFYNAS